MATEKDLFDEMEAAIGELRGALDAMATAVTTFRTERERGAPVRQIYINHDMRAVRDEMYDHLTRFERAFTALRAWGVRMFIDEDGLTFTEVGQMMNRSRQFVTRLYRSHDSGA